MAKVENRPVIQLACTECRERTYTTEKNKKNDPDRIELSKYCPRVPAAYAPPGGEVAGDPFTAGA